VSFGTARETREAQAKGDHVKLYAIIATLAFAACQTAETTAPTPQDPVATADGVTLRVATPDRLAGTYVDATGLGINFDTARAGDNLYMHITTTTGHELIHAETTADSYLFSYMDKRLTLEVSKAWVEQVRNEGEGGTAAQDESQMHWTGDMTVLDEMIALPEVRGLPALSRALGAAGYTGNTYPAALPLHKMARQSAEALGIDVQPLPEEQTQEGSLCTAYPNQGNQCYGMCGNGCSCWSWVCGDCCYHGGCARHDDWCRQGQWYYCYNITAVIALFGC
jgi:hypothetical protein